MSGLELVLGAMAAGAATALKWAARHWKGLATGGALALTVHDYGVWVNRVDGASMSPALNPGDVGHRGHRADWLLTVKLPFYRGCRGDVVTLRAPDGTRKLVKRLVGLEKDWIQAANGDYVYLTRGLCWVESDNAAAAGSCCDSNAFGPVPVALLKGTAKYVVWPPERWGWVRRGLPDAMGERRTQHILRGGPEVLTDDFLWKGR